MKLVTWFVIVIVTFAALGAIGFLLSGCGLHRPVSQAEFSGQANDIKSISSGQGSPMPNEVESPAVTRVGGDREAIAEFVDGEFRSGAAHIPTPLPAGYPPPTPPGAIELKRYPLVRRAEIGGTITPDWGMNLAFFPLFNHIKRRDIAMTSPVELNYNGLDTSGSASPSSWTMSFLYRTPDLAPSGVDEADERVLVEDIAPVTVVAIGMRGPYKLRRIRNGLSELRRWLTEQSEWETAGEPRALFYNGPEARKRDSWSEVQIPVRRRRG